MKVIIINDIKGDKESIIPYGLNLAKYLETEVILVHVVDPRVQQAVPGVIADSSSVSPGEKLLGDEMTNKELEESKLELNKYLSYEISRLNYPLKWGLDISVNSIENKMTELVENYPGALFVVNKEPDNYIFDSQKETVDITKTFEGLCLFVPPGEEFVPFNSVLIPTGFSDEEKKGILKVQQLLNHFIPVINLLGRPEHEEEKEITAFTDMDQLFPKATVNYNVLEKGNFDEEFIHYAKMLNPGLIVVLEEKKGFWSRLFKKELIKKLLETAESPVLYFSDKTA
jgi:hypothetical protein